MKEYKITKERLKAMAEECPEAEGILKKGFPEAFKDEGFLTDEFKREATRIMEELRSLVFQVRGNDENKYKRARWIVANLLYAYLPGKISSELGRPYSELREDR